MAELFICPLERLGAMDALNTDLSRGKTPVQITGCVPTQKVHFMYEVGKNYKWRLVVAADEAAARDIYSDFRQFDEDTVFYPPKDLIFYQADMQGKHLMGERIQVMKALCEDAGGTLITTVDGLMNVLPSLKQWKSSAISVSIDQEIRLEELRTDLVTMGYSFAATVTEPGEFSIRGDIIDVFPFTEEEPIRIDLFDVEVENIKHFDPDSQRTTRDQIESITIYPAKEFIVNEARKKAGTVKLSDEYDKQLKKLKKEDKWEAAAMLQGSVGGLIDELRGGVIPDNLMNSLRYFGEEGQSLLDYLPEDTICFANEPAAMSEAADGVFLEFEESTRNRLEGGYILPGQAGLIYKPKTIFDRLSDMRTVVLTGLDTRAAQLPVKNLYSLNATSMPSYKENTAGLITDLEKWHRAKYMVVLMYSSKTKARRMADYLQQYDLDAFYHEEGPVPVLPGQTEIVVGALRRGFQYSFIKYIVLTETDIFGKEQKKVKRTQYKGTRIGDLSDLKVGDYVVHESYGLGIYQGIERKFADHVWRDYIKIEYGDDSNLFIPATQFEYIQKYSDKDKENVKLNNLYGSEWKKTKAKVGAAVQKVAEELVELYAKRQSQKGHEFGEDTLWQKEFEETFPYEETEDQLRVIEEVKSDMESPKIMDRLVCGDVGFGKTEIALRAAFKAVQDGKQVVYLVPTTILAQQHYNTFTERMKDFPVRVDMLSRFRTKAEVTKTLEDLKKGLVDIVIGTHRVLSKDVEFKNLGLLIIDEEQRFGVTHKEKIKQLKTNVDVITMTATPIPRTLHMSLIGVRDMSVLEQAPSERLPIQTYVCEHTKELVREAVNRELKRGGQVYYVYNRVQGIAHVANELKELLPEARISFAHGQMGERELERIMLDFVNGEIDVLVSTTIIETGLDIPNVNTIIIDDADRMGLSQLYQLRGRVGRSNRTSYAFILYRQNKALKDEAEQRLEAIRQFTDLGSGVKIALKDLEIRGAGNVMGHDQHGHMEAVGYDLYCKMLNEAVMKLTGREEELEKKEAFIDITLDAYIPDSYISSESTMLDMYKRITTITNEDEYSELLDELIDRFGEPPVEVQNLLMVAVLKALATNMGATLVRADDRMGSITFEKDARINVDRLPEIVKSYNGQLRVNAGAKVVITYTPRDRNHQNLTNMCADLKKLLESLSI